MLFKLCHCQSNDALVHRPVLAQIVCLEKHYNLTDMGVCDSDSDSVGITSVSFINDVDRATGVNM